MLEAVIHDTLVEANLYHDALWLKDPDKRYAIYRVTRWDWKRRRPGEFLGFQVAEIHRVGHWGKASRGPALTPSQASREPAVTLTQVSVPKTDLVTVEMPFAQETNAYIGVLVEGKVTWFGKTTLIEYGMVGDKVRMTLAKKPVVKRGLEGYIVS